MIHYEVSAKNTQTCLILSEFENMGLYLCVFDGDDERDGVEIGSYADFAYFRDTVTDRLEGGDAGSKYPCLILHADSDGEWSPSECRALREELSEIARQFKELPGIAFNAEWQRQVGKALGFKPSCLYDSFIDVDGEPLLERLQRLCDTAVQLSQPILFQ
jgi:hypothetical protein